MAHQGYSDNVLYVPELLENILLKLEHKDIVIASGVCTFWQDCIAGSRHLQKRIHKLPISSGDDENPHFDDLTEDSRNAIIPRHELQGQNLWNLVRECEDECLSCIHMISDYESNKSWLEETVQSYWEKMYDIRRGFQDVRWPNGWPRELQLLHCDLCEKWHTDFRFEHLHPLFRFLGDINMCFRGHGQKFFISLHIVSSNMAPYDCWEDSCKEALHCARHLLQAYKAVEMGAVSKDLFLCPPAMKLVQNGFSCVEDKAGVTLDAVVPFMLRLFRGHLHYWRGRCHNFQTYGITRGPLARRDTAATYPTIEDWDKHMAAYSDITAMWEKAMAEIDIILSVVSFWEPVLAERLIVDDGELSIW